MYKAPYLIDAQALRDKVDGYYKRNNVNLSYQLIVYEATGPQMSPRVDAVPVEWLRTLMLEGEPEVSKAAWRVLKAWQEVAGLERTGNYGTTD